MCVSVCVYIYIMWLHFKEFYSRSLRFFPVLPRFVVVFTILDVLQSYFVKIIENLLKNLKKRFLWGIILRVQFTSAAFVKKGRIRRSMNCSWLCACVALNRTIGNACQGTLDGLFFCFILNINVTSFEHLNG